MLLLTRTNSELPKHDGLTLFLVPLETPGIEIQPVHTLVTHATNMTYYDDVRVDDDARIGPVDGGWQVMKVALGVEQAGGRPAYARQLVEAVVEWLRDDKTDRGSSELVRERLGRAFVAQEIGTLLGYRNVWGLTTPGRWKSAGARVQSCSLPKPMIEQRASLWRRSARPPSSTTRPQRRQPADGRTSPSGTLLFVGSPVGRAR